MESDNDELNFKTGGDVTGYQVWPNCDDSPL